MRSPRARPAVLFAALLLCLAAGRGAAQKAADTAPHPDMSGEWALDQKASDDVQTKVEAAAGPGQVKGGGRRAIRVFPTGNEKSEVERVELHDLLLSLIGSLERMEIVQNDRDVKLVRGDDVGIFYFDREHVREGPQGQQLRCRTTWKGSQLVIDQTGEEKAHVVQLLTLLPEGRRLILALRLERARLVQPLDLRLVYDRAGGEVKPER